MDVGSIPVNVVRWGTLWYAVVRSSRVRVFLEYLAIDALKYSRAPDLARDRGGTPQWGLMAGSAACCTTYVRHFPFAPCAATVQRAPSHNRWRVSETTLPAKTQGRTLDCPFNFPPPRVAGWFLMCRCQVCNRTAVAMVATGPRRGALFRHVESGLSVVVEWRFHSRQAGTTRRATNPQTGGRRPKKRLLRQVSPPGARGTVASLLVHVPAALRECRAHGLTQGGHPPRATVPRNGGLHPQDWRSPSRGLAGAIF